MLKEEHVRPIANDWDFAGSISGVLKQNKEEATKGLFDALFAQLSQRNLAAPETAMGTVMPIFRVCLAMRAASL